MGIWQIFSDKIVNLADFSDKILNLADFYGWNSEIGREWIEFLIWQTGC